MAQFLEEEAELSGSGDDVSSDENEEGLGGDLEDSDWIEKNPRAAGDAVQLQRDLERVHARLERDEDQRAVRFLQELYLPDGDLTTGESAARRRFRWRGVEADGEEGGDAPQLESDESDGDQEFSFVEDRRPALGGDAKLNTSVASTVRKGLGASPALFCYRSGDPEVHVHVLLYREMTTAPDTNI